VPVSSQRVVAPHRAKRRQEMGSKEKGIKGREPVAEGSRAACFPVREGFSEGFSPACLPLKEKKAERSIYLSGRGWGIGITPDRFDRGTQKGSSA